MTDDHNKINQLHDKLEELLKRQDSFSREIDNLRTEIYRLKSTQPDYKSKKEEIQKNLTSTESKVEEKKENVKSETENIQSQAISEPTEQIVQPIEKSKKGKSDLEKFIGENLISKIGIAITVIGVAIGAKYSIENELISPLTRIILGYLAGLGLLGVAIKLKKKYENYSAVLLSGSMAIMYFITYSAYSFYDLFPQVFAFLLMVLFTAFTVVAAVQYNRTVIAHIGLVGAYAVPFLLSEGSGKIAVFFSYISVINVGILVVAIKKYWKSLYYSAFGLTWLIYAAWYLFNYESKEHFTLAFSFLAIFFIIFYMTFLSYKLFKKEKFVLDDIILVMANSFVFYGIGYALLAYDKIGEELLGLFTLGNAVLHFIVSSIIYRQKLADKNLLYLISGLVLVFITLAIPVQLDGNWVTLIWSGEAALLFWIGRTKNVAFYEKLSYLLMVLAFFSILHDWTTVYGGYNPQYPETRITPLLNINFLTSILFILAFGFISYISRAKDSISSNDTLKDFLTIFSYVIPSILIFSIFYAFQLEIANYWDQLYADSAIKSSNNDQLFSNFYRNTDLLRYKTIWLINFSLLFLSLIALVNLKKIKSKELGLINLLFIVIALLVFLVPGLLVISELRESYLEQPLSQYYERGFFNIGIRYISLAFVVLSLVSCYLYIRNYFKQKEYKMAFDFVLHTTVLWVLSSEFIHWMDMVGSAQTYKLGLSVLWGVYSLFLIVLGIWKKNKPLRIGAMALFGMTLLKLFFYDISHLNTISKTVVFVSLGILLLVISFLYNKYKHIISETDENEN